MKNLLSFEQFIIAEAKNGERVAIFPGRFQPFHNGHIASLRRTAQVFQCKVIPVQILSKTDKSPFHDALLTKMGDAIAKEFEFIADYCLYPQDRKTVIPQMVKYIREEMGFEPGSKKFRLRYTKTGISASSFLLMDCARCFSYIIRNHFPCIILI